MARKFDWVFLGFASNVHDRKGPVDLPIDIESPTIDIIASRSVRQAAKVEGIAAILQFKDEFARTIVEPLHEQVESRIKALDSFIGARNRISKPKFDVSFRGPLPRGKHLDSVIELLQPDEGKAWPYFGAYQTSQNPTSPDSALGGSCLPSDLEHHPKRIMLLLDGNGSDSLHSPPTQLPTLSEPPKPPPEETPGERYACKLAARIRQIADGSHSNEVAWHEFKRFQQAFGALAGSRPPRKLEFLESPEVEEITTMLRVARLHHGVALLFGEQGATHAVAKENSSQHSNFSHDEFSATEEDRSVVDLDDTDDDGETEITTSLTLDWRRTLKLALKDEELHMSFSGGGTIVGTILERIMSPSGGCFARFIDATKMGAALIYAVGQDRYLSVLMRTRLIREYFGISDGLAKFVVVSVLHEIRIIGDHECIELGLAPNVSNDRTRLGKLLGFGPCWLLFLATHSDVYPLSIGFLHSLLTTPNLRRLHNKKHIIDWAATAIGIEFDFAAFLVMQFDEEYLSGRSGLRTITQERI